MKERLSLREELSRLLDGVLPAERAAELRARLFPRRAALLWGLAPLAAALLVALLWPRGGAEHESAPPPDPDPDPPSPAAVAEAAATLPPPSLKAVEEGHAPSDAVRRAAYLAALHELDAEALRTHIVAAGRRRAGAANRGAGLDEVGVQVGGAEEAERIGGLVARAFAGSVRREALDFEVETDAGSAEAIRTWLELLDSGPKIRGAILGAKPKGEGSGEPPRAPPNRRLRIVIRHPGAESGR